MTKKPSVTLNWIRAYHSTSTEGMELLRVWLKTFEDLGLIQETKPGPSLFPWNQIKIYPPADYTVEDIKSGLTALGIPKGCFH